MSVVAKVWIEDDCITCDAFQDVAPEVFIVTEESSQILAAVRVDYRQVQKPTKLKSK